MAKYWTSKYGTKIDVTGLDAATLKRVQDLANQKYGTKATEIANQFRAKQASTTANTAQTTTQTAAPTPPAPTQPAPTQSQVDPNSIAAAITPNAQGLIPTDASALERARAIIGMGEQLGRRVGSEFYADGSLGRQAETLTPEEMASMQRIRDFAAQAGLQSSDVAALLQQQRGILDESRQLSALEQEAINVSRAGLEGLNAPEMEGLRSAARENIVGERQAQARALAKAQARNQVFGSAALAQNRLLNQDAIKQTRNLERDLLVKNIDIKQAARNAFNNLVTTTESNRAGRTNAASNTLASTTLTDENQRKTAQAGASKLEGDLATSLGDRLRSLREFNLNQAAAERAGRLGSIFGGIGLLSDQRGLLAGEEFTNKQYEESQAVKDQIFDIIRQSLKQSKSVL